MKKSIKKLRLKVSPVIPLDPKRLTPVAGGLSGGCLVDTDLCPEKKG